MSPKVGLDQWAPWWRSSKPVAMRGVAERLHRTQSTVTYTIKKLEEQLGIRVFELQGRKAVLTPTGQLLYRRGKALLAEAARLERAAAELARGHEPQIRLAVDIIFPTWLLLDCLAAFGASSPTHASSCSNPCSAGRTKRCLQAALIWPSAAPCRAASSASR